MREQDRQLRIRSSGAGGSGGASPVPHILEKTKEQTERARPWNVIVLNDPVTLMSYVVMVFRKVFGYPYEKAHVLMMEVHLKGRSIVWTGAREQAEVFVQKLHANQLLAQMEQVDS